MEQMNGSELRKVLIEKKLIDDAGAVNVYKVNCNIRRTYLAIFKRGVGSISEGRNSNGRITSLVKNGL